MIRAHTRVTRTSTISTAARELFFIPNWIGVNKKLNIRLRAKGKAMARDNIPVKEQ